MILAREKPVVFCHLDAIAISCQPGYHLMLGCTILTSWAIIPSPLTRAPVIVAIPDHLVDTTNFIYSVGEPSLSQHIGTTPDMVRPPLRRWEVIRSVSTPGGSQLEEQFGHKVRHGYTEGRVSLHRTRTPRHRTRIRYLPIPNHESGGILRNPRYINYKIIKLIITTTKLYLQIQ